MYSVPCTCGHIERMHKEYVKGFFICNECWFNINNNNLKVCDRYIPDNLGYIEKLAEQKGLI